MNIETISKVGTSTKYKYDDGLIVYRMDNVLIEVRGDLIRIEHDYLHPNKAQKKYNLTFGQITIQYGTSTAEEYVEYLIENDFFLSTPNKRTASLDSLNRQRVSTTGQREDVEFIYDKQEEFFDEVTNNGTVTFNANSRDLTLALDNATDGSSAEMSSYPVPYTPGNSQLIEPTGVLDLAGIGGGTAEVFLRSKVTGTVTEETIEQSEWLNMTGGLDWTKAHIFTMDFQSLKVGSIRYEFSIGGIPVKVAQIDNDNKRNTGFWQTPSLPVFYRIYNDATSTYMEIGYGNSDNAIGFRYKIAANANATMKAICSTVKSEGGYHLVDLPGLPRHTSNGTVPVVVGATLIPILSIRAKDLFKTFNNLGLVLPKSYGISTDNEIEYKIIHEGTLTGALWVDVGTNSMVEKDVSATAISGGIEIDGDYITTGTKNSTTSGLLGKTVLWNRLGNISGILTIAAVKTSVSDADVKGSIRWEEIR